MSGFADRGHLVERVSDLVDGQLSEDATQRAFVHLADCRVCRDASDAERLIKSRLASLEEPQPDAELMNRLLALGEFSVAAFAQPVGAGAKVRVVGSPLQARERPPGRPVRRSQRWVKPTPVGRSSRRSNRARLAAAVFGAISVVGVSVTALSVGPRVDPSSVSPPVDHLVINPASSPRASAGAGVLDLRLIPVENQGQFAQPSFFTTMTYRP